MSLIRHVGSCKMMGLNPVRGFLYERENRAMDISQLYGIVDPDFKLPEPETTPAAGQLFLREAGKGLTMVCGLLVLPTRLQMETIYPAKIQIRHNDGEKQDSIGHSMDGMLKYPCWRIHNPNF